MKKFASIFICVLLAALMVFTTVASAASVLPTTPTTAKLTLYKYTTDKANEEAQSPQTPPVSSDQKGVAGATYTAYKIASLNADGTFTVETAFANLTVDGKALSTLFATDKLAQNTGSLTYADTNAFEKYIPALRQEIERGNYVGASGTTADGTGGTTLGKAEIDNLALGVYLVIETTIPDNYAETSKPFLVQLPQWDQDANEGAGVWLYNVTAYPKNDPVDLEKKIVESNQTKVDETTRAIGDVVNYEIVVDVPYYGDLEPAQIAKIKYFLTDTMSAGLTFNDDVTVTVLNAPEGTGPLVDKETNASAYDFEVTTSSTTVIKVDFTPATVYKWKGYQLSIKYSATLNENALIGAANTNKAKLTFTTNPRTGKVDPDTDDTDEDETKVYTYGMDLKKKFNNGTEAPDASAVEFTLKDSTNATMQFVQLSAGNYLVVGKDWADNYVVDGKIKLPTDADAAAQTEYTVTTVLHPTSTGSLQIRGLNVGTYTLTETKTVNGYSKLESDITIVVTGDTTSDELNGKVSATANGSNLTANEREVETEETTTPEGDPVEPEKVGSNGVFEIEVNNVSEQFNLPQTGGAGLLAFTIGGSIVIAGAIILFSFLRKKKSAK